MPGHADRCDYTADPGEFWSAPDMEKAHALVEESGTKGQKVTVVADDTSTGRAVGTYLQAVLTDLGYDATVQSISGDIQFTYIQNTNNNVRVLGDAVVSGLPRALELPERAVRLRQLHPGVQFLGEHVEICDKGLDDRMKAAMAMAGTDPAAALTEWGNIDYDMMKLAPAVPLFTPKDVDLISTRMGNYEF